MGGRPGRYGPWLLSSSHLLGWWVWEKEVMDLGTWSPPFLLGSGSCRSHAFWSVSSCGVFCRPSTGSRCLRQRVSLLDFECSVGEAIGTAWLSFVLQSGFERQYRWPLDLHLSHSFLSHNWFRIQEDCHLLGMLQSLASTEHRTSEHKARTCGNRRTSPLELDIQRAESDFLALLLPLGWFMYLFPQLQNGDNSSFITLLWGSDEISYKKNLRLCLAYLLPINGTWTIFYCRIPEEGHTKVFENLKTFP